MSIKREIIEKELHSFNEFHKKVLMIRPDFFSVLFPKESKIPLAITCFRDAADTICEVKYALLESYHHRNKPVKGDQRYTRNFLVKYFSDDVALRLYSAGEHLANAIINMMNLDDKELEKWAKKRSSVASTIGNYLISERKDHFITKELLKLQKSKYWIKVIRYRNEWVHEQPPIISGLGIVYKRGSQWEISKKETKTEQKSIPKIILRNGDKANLTSLKLLVDVENASYYFIIFYKTMFEYFLKLFEQLGIKFDWDNMRFKVGKIGKLA